jgi:mRNA-degrading endonuclease RelE of RelBE toxin-antitoxin system
MEVVRIRKPRKRYGKGLSYDKHGLWRYRIGNHRITCRIEEEELTVLVVTAEHRKNIYDSELVPEGGIEPPTS